MSNKPDNIKLNIVHSKNTHKSNSNLSDSQSNSSMGNELHTASEVDYSYESDSDNDSNSLHKSSDKIKIRKNLTCNDTYIRTRNPENGKKYKNNWTPAIEKKLYEIRDKYLRYIWANNKRSQYFKKWNNIYIISNIIITGISATVFTYLTGLSTTPTFTILGICASLVAYYLFVINGLYAAFRPDQKVANHNAASVALSDSLYNLERQLNIPINSREKGDELYGWVIRELVTLLSNTPKIYKKWYSDYDDSDNNAEIKNKLNPDNEGRYYNSMSKTDVPFIL